MKVKDWLSVVNLDSGGSIITIRIYDNERFFVKSFNTIEDTIEEYGEIKINCVTFGTLFYGDEISVGLILDIQHVR